eukprot:4825158-Amphidinium_carterae.1
MEDCRLNGAAQYAARVRSTWNIKLDTSHNSAKVLSGVKPSYVCVAATSTGSSVIRVVEEATCRQLGRQSREWGRHLCILDCSGRPPVSFVRNRPPCNTHSLRQKMTSELARVQDDTSAITIHKGKVPQKSVTFLLKMSCQESKRQLYNCVGFNVHCRYAHQLLLLTAIAPTSALENSDSFHSFAMLFHEARMILLPRFHICYDWCCKQFSVE